MAKLKESVIGVLIGQIGQVVGSTWKGISVLRVLPASVANPQDGQTVDAKAEMGCYDEVFTADERVPADRV